MFRELLDSLSIWGVAVLFTLLALLLYEIGFRFGRWWQDRTHEEIKLGHKRRLTVGKRLVAGGAVDLLLFGPAVRPPTAR